MNTKKYIVVTGSSSGIGYETAKAFAARGKNLIIIARRRDRLMKLKEEILEINPESDVVIREADLSSNDETIKLYESLKDYDIETWINNAGRGNHGDITNPELPRNLDMLHLNMDAVAILSSLYIRDYKDTEGSQLINVSSVGGYTLFRGATMYSATKFFVSALTEGIDHEMKAGGHKLRAKVLAPGATETEFEQVANELAETVDYDKKFFRYHTAAQMAGFLLELYEGDKTVGEFDFESFGIKLSDAKHPYFNGL
ncbi:SDR family NAD(P)-dependent oxidoreductase [Lederbergia citri]|uniref:SDR family NAD(P)-dependent oxidoreductase n=1 Tax=Lederbergia citri TaxID=2833580 RepID=A0A942THX7_9BACI|nr:SDR family NAD(P)-dependent oxidoreductase [Lederbergia citri]MBS4197903.1 SDR family NAD(P)-dependent oxidoreductase [Lederbergia citri]